MENKIQREGFLLGNERATFFLYLAETEVFGARTVRKNQIRLNIENKVIQSEEFNTKESRRYNVSVSINHH